MHEDCKCCPDWNDYRGECSTPRWCPVKEPEDEEETNENEDEEELS